MRLGPDQWVLWQHGFAKLDATIAFTWILMLGLTLGSWLITRRLCASHERSRWQNVLEILVSGIEGQIADVGVPEPRRVLPFVATLFVFVAACALCTVVPGFEPPTGSLSTTVALAACVFVAVPLHGVRRRGLRAYLRSYLDPTPLMLPFNLIGEVSRTLALAVRLFGNMMSGAMILGILLTITPFVFPVVMTALGLLTGMVQAYIFSILATVYLAAAVASPEGPPAASSTPRS